MIPIVAIMYDFDKTLSPRDMQEYAFIPGIGMTAEEAREKIKTFQHLLPCPIRVEEGVSWLHFDVMPNDAGVKVFGFTEN